MANWVGAIGEAMVEFACRSDWTWSQVFDGDTQNVAWAMRALLPDCDASVRYMTRFR